MAPMLSRESMIRMLPMPANIFFPSFRFCHRILFPPFMRGSIPCGARLMRLPVPQLRRLAPSSFSRRVRMRGLDEGELVHGKNLVDVQDDDEPFVLLPHPFDEIRVELRPYLWRGLDLPLRQIAH